MDSGTAMTVRLARSDDAAPVALLHHRSWQKAYVDVLPGPRLNEANQAYFEALWKPYFDGALESSRAFVAEAEGRLVGVVLITIMHDEDYSVEVGRLYVDPDRQGAGIGSRLLDHAEAAAVQDGCQRGLLWLVEGHSLAQRFYERRGWAPTGEQQLHQFPDWSARECRYAVSLKRPAR